MVEIMEKEGLKMKDTKIMICLPTKGQMMTKTTDSLIQAFVHSQNMGVNITITYAEGTLVSAVRSALVKRFLESDYTHLFFIDSDMVFNKDLILKLLEMNKDIACGVAKVRGGKSYNIYHWVPEQEKYAPVNRINLPQIIEVDATGCACILIRRCVFEDIMSSKERAAQNFKDLWSKETDPFMKQIFYNLSKDNAAFVAIGEKSEDINFFEFARVLGYKIYCNLGLKVGHICDDILM